MMISEEDFTLQQDRLAHIAHYAYIADIEGFLHRLRTTRKAAAKLDAELYANLEDVEAIEDVANALLEFKQKLALIRKECRRRWARGVLKGEIDGRVDVPKKS